MGRIITTKANAATLADGPTRTLFGWLVGVFLLTLLPHAAQLPGWLVASILIVMAVRCLAEWKRWPLPSTTSTGVVAACLLGGIYLQYNTVLGHEAGAAFIAGVLAIKFFELRGPRDITVIIFSSFFMVMSALLFSQAIELFVYCLIMMWLLTAVLLRVHLGDRTDHRLLPILGRASLIFIQALPPAVLLFFFFPRYEGRFQIHLNDAITGLSDRVEPGTIAQLANDDSRALRVEFAPGSPIPTPETMYWRAIVLWYFDGRAWTRGPSLRLGQTSPGDLPGRLPTPLREGDLIEQQITIWPQIVSFFPALDRPVTLARDPDNSDPAQPRSRVILGGVLETVSGRSIDYKRKYLVASSLVPLETDPQKPLGKLERSEALQLPAEINPGVKNLAVRLHAPNRDTSAFVRTVLAYFRTNHFTLTTEPGALGPDPVGEFLFKTRSGFCEHYASAFAVLMRVEGVPARMVVGYRGGELNAYRPFYTINNSDAHAWDEVWVESRQRWVRVDPTAVISSGTPFALRANNGEANDDDLALNLGRRRLTFLSTTALPPWLREGIRAFQMRREEAEAEWDDWVFSYDPAAQDRLARALGLGPRAWWGLLVISLAVMALGGGVAAWWLGRRRHHSRIEAFYARFCRRMAQRGVPREPWEGPRAYGERLARRFPAQQRPIGEAGRIVAEYRYGSGEEPAREQLKEILQAASERS